MLGLLIAYCGIFGLIVGSFLNVVIYRVPLKESIVTPRSACPTCGTQISSARQHPNCLVAPTAGEVSRVSLPYFSTLSTG